MNEQLRKAIEEATKVETNTCGYCGQTEYVEPEEHLAPQAKLMRVIELLVVQRDDFAESLGALSADFPVHQRAHTKYLIQDRDAELIAAMENEGEGM